MTTRPEGNAPAAASPYSTGGGGTVLEHRYGAVLLSHLLTGDPISELGDDVAPARVAFQASTFSPVDDLVVWGRSADGLERRVSIGVRRAPSLVPSEEASVQLVSSYLRVVSDHWPQIQAGRWRLALAVAGPNAAVRQVHALVEIARHAPDEAHFRAEVARLGRTNQATRRRLERLDALVRAASGLGEVDASLVPTEELTWRLLSALWLRELRLEGSDTADRTATVGRLRAVTQAGTPAAADALFSRLAELAGHYAPAAAVATETTLRRDLAGMLLRRSSVWAQGWAVLDRLAGRLRDRTGSCLGDATGAIELDRAEARAALAAALGGAACARNALVVLGEPEVGKSALALRATEDLAAKGTVVAAVTLRDLPETTAALESLLGGALMEVLAGAAVDRGRLLLVDGAEAVLEGRDGLLADLAVAALRAGLGVAAVTRTDAAAAVSDVLRQAGAAADGAGAAVALAEHEVPQLDPAEIEQLTRKFASLARLAREPRAAWLLGRPGLVSLLLRGDAMPALSDGALSEADVFAAVWHGLVRRREITLQSGPSPDARERTLTVLARRLLLAERSAAASPEPAALPSLRSDGLLLSAGPTSAWNPGDQFASDLVRDLSVARLLLTEGLELLIAARAPRWALRAARMACQARLAAAGPDTEPVSVRLQQLFDRLAAEHGARWAELPLEAMLTLGSAGEVLAAAWPALIAGEGDGLAMLLRVALQRYSQHGVGDAVILASLAELVCDRADDLVHSRQYGRRGETGEQVRELVLAWLRGLVVAEAGTVALRARVRDLLLDHGLLAYDEFAVEAIGLLGPDLDERAEAFLRWLADDGGGYLAPAVESVHVGLSMSAYDPELLLALAEAYYLEKLDPDDPVSPSHSSMLDDGVRRHTGIGNGVPMAAWYFGPFFVLLRSRPVQTLRMINRLLDHAAAVRVGGLDPGHRNGESPGDAPSGLELDLPGVGLHLCIGDDHVWSWYRGSSVGPPACMSALLAVERFADELVGTHGAPLELVSQALLRECRNLAMPGLVVGLLVRHLDGVVDELERWLAQPQVWDLEFRRATLESGVHLQGADDAKIPGRARRAYTFREVADELTVRAVLADDQQRIAALHQVGEKLLRRARETIPEGTKERSVVAGWASYLRAENYRPVKLDGGGRGLRYEPPPEVTAGLAPSLVELDRGQQATRLLMRYAVNEDRSAPVDILADDITLARAIAADPASYGFRAEDAVAGTAAVAVVAHARGRARLAAEDIRWAADVLVEAALNGRHGPFDIPQTVFSMAADRSAAVGLPALVLPSLATAPVERATVEQGLLACARSMFGEVRRALAVGLAPVWRAPCDTASGGRRCRHQIAWEAVEASLRDCQLGRWNHQRQRRDIKPVVGPLAEALGTVPANRLLVDRLTGPLVAAADAARSGCCIAEPARRLLHALLEAHRRGAAYWAARGWQCSDEDHCRIAHVLLTLAVDGDGEPLAEHVRAFTGNAPALRQLLDDLSLLCTYDAGLRQGLPTVWPAVAQVALDAIDAGDDPRKDHHWGDWAVASLILHPQPDVADRNPAAAIEAASRDWIDLRTLEELIARWLPIACGNPRAVDALLDLIDTAPPRWQATTALRWVDALIHGHYAAIARQSWRLPAWLKKVRAFGPLEPADAALFQRIVDGLAAHGDTRMVQLQRADEGG